MLPKGGINRFRKASSKPWDYLVSHGGNFVFAPYGLYNPTAVRAGGWMRFVFQNFTLDGHRRELRRGEGLVPLERRSSIFTPIWFSTMIP
jgi:hypothetical protein